MAILLWGAATCGKTTFAATAPGDKLWLSFGDQEHVSVMRRTDVHVANLSELSASDLFKHAQSDNPFNLDTFLSENENVETVVADSLTAIAFRALQQSVAKGIGGGGKFAPSMESPGVGAYGGRNAIVLEVVTGLLRVTAKHGVHIILTAHEDDPSLDAKGLIDHISVMLGGKLVNNMTWRLSEVWYMSQAPHGERERKLAIRPTRLRKPMKTRMFKSNGDPEFVLNYDADSPDEAKNQMTIAKWFEEWRATNGEKLTVPGAKPVSLTQTKSKG